MPRKYKDGDIVTVYYASRSQYFEFIGKVTDYSNKKYDVLYLGETHKTRHRAHAFKADVVFKCWVYELSYANAKFLEEVLPTVAQQSFSKFCKDYLGSSRWYSPSSKQEKFAWYSFKTKRLLDADFSRVFPVIQFKDRGDYIYDY